VSGTAAAFDPLARLRGAVSQAAGAVRGADGEVSGPTLERPPRVEFGDYSSNVAMLLAPALESQPRDIAELIGERLREGMKGELDHVEIAGPGFLNLFLADPWFCAALASIRAQGDGFGANVIDAPAREQVLVEFVSANPTGPLTVAGGRHAAFGDALARVLAFAGHEVEREFYINDEGTQVELFGRSIAAAMTGDPIPEGGYQGDYVRDLAGELAQQGVGADDVEALSRLGVELMVERVRATLERFRVSFDRWYSERTLHEEGRIERTFASLEESGYVYVSEGATWLRTSALGDDKDRVLRRSSGELTYFGSDIAHHEQKREWGYDRLINVLGADHHGYVARIKAAFEALGGERDRLEVIIMQLVHVVERGDRAQMSKRKGEFVTLDELVDDIGVDAARFFMLQRSHDTALDIDLDLAREQSQENPVYYVQYAHARIASILANVDRARLEEAQAADVASFEVALEPAERALIKRLLELPDQVGEAAARRAPHRLTTYAHQVASDFHAFYRDCRVIGAPSPRLEDLRLCLCMATRSVIARSLALLGVEAPERM
jgi:arginyl-tRNA synthetase